ncbi:carbohydrate ABC transporter permease [Leucobacter salsicius]|uniref:carbohydrate ABC transporter permease n=1 Tax=Leucobacter salsicius TaxID=664638 RepID=UPI000376D925|nr:sugar ABC transporter permease [Leucobacter salsicius]
MIVAESRRQSRQYVNSVKAESVLPILLVTPATVGLALCVGLPTLLSLVGSFFSIPLVPGAPWQFVGFDNFVFVFTDDAVLQSIVNTFVYSALTIVPSLAIGLGLALLANAVVKGRALVRTLLFLPMTANLVAMSVVFNWIFSFNGGFVNQVLGLLGVAPINWTGDSQTSLLTVAMVGVWRTASLTMMIFFAGLATIPTSIDEATRSDGIRGLVRLTKITLPLIAPTVVFASVMAVLNSVQVFESINIMTQGGPLGSSETVLTMIWKLGFEYFELGRASALSFVLLAVLVLLGVLQRRTLAGGVK